ncbi:MAG: patatin-like phospholipase family protein [Caldisericaceae bacterium]|nr:patatin-like phospholipase family protein [Caldisericaceae bacterium]
MAELGLALGGGGARGLAHIGVLKVLEKEKIKIQAITGCSMGAIVGGLYAYFGSAQKVEDFIRDILHSPKIKELGLEELSENGSVDKSFFEQFFDFVDVRLKAIKSLSRLSYFDQKTTDKIFSFIPDVPIEELPIPISAIATDLVTGAEVNFTTGSLRKVIQASAAVPGIFPPVKIEEYLLVDGSASESVPAGKVKEIGADRVLAVNVSRDIKIFTEPSNLIEILFRSEDITSYQLSQIRLKEADLVVTPKVRDLSWVDFDKIDYLVAAGKIAALEHIEEIRALANRNAYLLEMEQFLKRLKGII